LLSAGNLGANSILGYVESFKANYFCRLCCASKEQCHNMVCERSDIIRTKEQHAEYVKEEYDRQNESHTYVVKRNSIFYELKYFNVAENQTIDIMHDILEGIFQYELKLVLNHCIFSNVFTENTVNRRINAYDYGISESSDKPISYNLIKPGKDLGLSAAQSWCLARHFINNSLRYSRY
jgi:hypothetical protein